MPCKGGRTSGPNAHSLALRDDLLGTGLASNKGCMVYTFILETISPSGLASASDHPPPQHTRARLTIATFETHPASTSRRPMGEVRGHALKQRRMRSRDPRGHRLPTRGFSSRRPGRGGGRSGPCSFLHHPRRKPCSPPPLEALPFHAHPPLISTHLPRDATGNHRLPFQLGPPETDPIHPLSLGVSRWWWLLLLF